jgi:acyl-CoA thioester hydrolase
MLESHGFPQPEFERLRFGPVMFREEIRYRREVQFGDEVAVNVLIAGLAPDGTQWSVVQEVRRADGKPAAILTIDGAWIHLDSRRLIAPPTELTQLLARLHRIPGFRELRSIIRRPGR